MSLMNVNESGDIYGIVVALETNNSTACELMTTNAAVVTSKELMNNIGDLLPNCNYLR